MAIIGKTLGPYLATTSATNVDGYTVAGGKQYNYKHIHVVNEGASDARLWISVGTMGAGKHITYNRFVAGDGGEVDWDLFEWLEATQFLQVRSSISNALVITVGGLELG